MVNPRVVLLGALLDVAIDVLCLSKDALIVDWASYVDFGSWAGFHVAPWVLLAYFLGPFSLKRLDPSTSVVSILGFVSFSVDLALPHVFASFSVARVSRPRPRERGRWQGKSVDTESPKSPPLRKHERRV